MFQEINWKSCVTKGAELYARGVQEKELKSPGRTANLETSAGFRAMTHEIRASCCMWFPGDSCVSVICLLSKSILMNKSNKMMKILQNGCYFCPSSQSPHTLQSPYTNGKHIPARLSSTMFYPPSLIC